MVLAVDKDKPKNQTYVIKQLYPQAQGTDTIEKATQLFKREAEQLDVLGKHLQIPELLAYFTESEHQYLVQECIDGRDLEQILETEEKFSEAQIIDVLQQVLPILAYLQQHQIIHRDIKPENIIRRRDGKLILIDFGAAKHLSTAAKSAIGTHIGSAGYRKSQTQQRYLQFGGATCVEPEDLYEAIERLWVKSSHSKFGFSIQKEIYKSLGGTRDYVREIWEKFGNAVGWRKEGQWKSYSKLQWDAGENATKGHLPPFGVLWFGNSFVLLSRADL
jgi:serine/threonine protein kinase